MDKRPAAAETAKKQPLTYREWKRRKMLRLARNWVIFLAGCGAVIALLTNGILWLLPKVHRMIAGPKMFAASVYDGTDYAMDPLDGRLVLVNANLPYDQEPSPRLDAADEAGTLLEAEAAMQYRCLAAAAEADGILLTLVTGYQDPETRTAAYEQQRQQVLDNTRLLLSGRPANNVLLFGDGGTGKSATVKSMLYREGMEDLRLIEIQKENLTGLPQLMRSLGGRRQKFILFIDDLAFDQDDRTYSSLKTILEGSLERRPANVAIYATSNRRHLVRQNFSDRGSDEVDAAETISEKTALAERFGLRIPYLTMNKSGYLALVDHLAGQSGITMDREVLHAQAMTWEIRHSGRTPRVARQFIASLLQ